MVSTTLLRFATLLTLAVQAPTPNASSPSPGPRTEAYMVYDATRRETILFGGWTQEKTGSDIVYPDALWAWDGERWRRRGGVTRDRRLLDDTWEYDGRAWVKR